jgi:hypothetical protein
MTESKLDSIEWVDGPLDTPEARAIVAKNCAILEREVENLHVMTEKDMKKLRTRACITMCYTLYLNTEYTARLQTIGAKIDKILYPEKEKKKKEMS